MAFSEEQEDTLLAYATFFSILSLAGSILVLVSYVRFRELRVFAMQLIAYLALADVGTDVAYYLGDAETGTFRCTTQAVMRVYFNLVAILLTTVIANFLYEVIVFNNFDLVEQQQRRPTYLWFAWGAPVLPTLLPFTTGNYGNNGAWCSVTSDTGDYWWGVLWHIGCLYLPCWVAIGYNLSVFLTVQRFVRGLQLSDLAFEDEDETVKRRERQQRSVRTQVVERLQLYPLVLVVSWTWATIYCIQSTLEPDHPIFWLACVAYSLCSLMGFLNACVYMLTPAVWKLWTANTSLDPAQGGSVFCTEMGCLLGSRRSRSKVDDFEDPAHRKVSENSHLLGGGDEDHEAGLEDEEF